MTIGIGLTSQIPRRELGPAMGPFPRPLRGAPIGIGLSRRLIAGVTAATARRAEARITRPGFTAQMPTDRPARPVPRTREEAGFEQAQGEVEIAGASVGPPVDLGGVVRFIGKALDVLGGIARAVPGAQVIGGAVQAVGGAVQRAAPPPVAAAPPPTIGESAAALERIAEQEAVAPGELTNLEFSEGTVNLETGRGTVKTVRGVEEFTFDVISLDGT